MNSTDIITCIILLALSAGSFFIGCLQLKEKGCLFHNTYFWAAQNERQRMDESRESKRPYYRQSGVVFLLVGVLWLLCAACIAAGWVWLRLARVLVIVAALVYAAASSVRLGRRYR